MHGRNWPLVRNDKIESDVFSAKRVKRSTDLLAKFIAAGDRPDCEKAYRVKAGACNFFNDVERNWIDREEGNDSSRFPDVFAS